MRIRRSRSATWASARPCRLPPLFLLWALFLDAAHVIPPVGAEYAPFGDAVPMSKLGQMQFHRGQDTTYKRSSPIPQLRCVKGCEFEPAVVQCTNVKPRENKSNWRCETDLPRHLKFDETTIICEGFEYPTDNKVLKGSCGLEYSLTRTGWSPLQSRHYKHYMAVAEEDEMKGWSASWMIVIGVMLYLLHHNWRSFNFAVPGGTFNFKYLELVTHGERDKALWNIRNNKAQHNVDSVFGKLSPIIIVFNSIGHLGAEPYHMKFHCQEVVQKLCNLVSTSEPLRLANQTQTKYNSRRQKLSRMSSA